MSTWWCAPAPVLMSRSKDSTSSTRKASLRFSDSHFGVAADSDSKSWWVNRRVPPGATRFSSCATEVSLAGIWPYEQLTRSNWRPDSMANSVNDTKRTSADGAFCFARFTAVGAKSMPVVAYPLEDSHTRSAPSPQPMSSAVPSAGSSPK